MTGKNYNKHSININTYMKQNLIHHMTNYYNTIGQLVNTDQESDGMITA